jgi:hypothetical protein
MIGIKNREIPFQKMNLELIPTKFPSKKLNKIKKKLIPWNFIFSSLVSLLNALKFRIIFIFLINFCSLFVYSD